MVKEDSEEVMDHIREEEKRLLDAMQQNDGNCFACPMCGRFPLVSWLCEDHDVIFVCGHGHMMDYQEYIYLKEIMNPVSFN